MGVCSRLSLGLWGCSLDWGEASYYVLLLLLFLLSLPFVFGVWVSHLPFGLAVAPWAFAPVIPSLGFLVSEAFCICPWTTFLRLHTRR